MTDLATISTALASIKTAVDIARIIKDGEKSLEQAEFKFKVAELLSALADAKMEIAAIQDTLFSKEQEILSLKASMRLQKDVVWQDPYYFLKSDELTDGPFCQQCYDNERKLIRLITNGYANGVWVCHTCKNSVTDDSYVQYE